jgi:hypothetical protein
MTRRRNRPPPPWATEALAELREAFGSSWTLNTEDESLGGQARGAWFTVERAATDDGWLRATLGGEGPEVEGMHPRSAAGAVRACIARMPVPPPVQARPEGGRP